jgi:hypothetical protein
MTLSMKEDEFPDPSDVGLLSANTVVFEPDDLPDLVQEFDLPGGPQFGLYSCGVHCAKI